MAYKTFAQVRAQILKYCARQERSHQEVKQKLYEAGCNRAEVEELLCFLIEENFINEERFARAYVRGKFNYLRWGRQKIRQGLEQHRVSRHNMNAALKEEIDETEYRRVAADLAAKRAAFLPTDLNGYETKAKLTRYLAGKGFEWEVIEQALAESGC